jgi:deoxyribonuclease-4
MAEKVRTDSPGRRRIGFHVSIAGGLYRAAARAAERECTAFQIFCDNPRGWATSRRPREALDALRAARAAVGLSPLVVHACYLINPCASDASVFTRTVRRMAHELRTAAEIGADFYVLHPGSRKGSPASWRVQRATKAIIEAAGRAGASPPILLENMAAPHGPGGSFQQLGQLIASLLDAEPGIQAGLALDSCHAFGAGYDLRDPAGVDRLLGDVDVAVGLWRVRLLHANDARDPCGSGRDRHWHIGQGTVGAAGLRNLLAHPALVGLPIILETPWESAQTDLRNIRALRRLLGGQSSDRPQASPRCRLP